MEDLAASMRRERAVSALLPLFFVSGATALVYQTLWVRELNLVFGTSTFAIATVLAAFMAGLALGGFLLGRVADRISHPLMTYGILEIGIGVYALVFPFLVSFMTPIYLEVWRAMQPGPVLFGLIQFTFVGLLLLLPTALMGGTLPLLARFATQRMGAAGDRIGTLYAVNTAGAVFGTWFAGFILLPSAGRFTTTLLAALANIVLGLAAVALDVWAKSQEEIVVEQDLANTTPPPALFIVALSIGVAGFSALIYEVAWTRLMALMLGPSVYAFSVMLLAFLIGIAIGGKLGGPLADKLLASGGQKRVLIVFAGVEVGIAVLTYVFMYLYPELPFWYVYLFDFVGAADKPGWMWVASLVLSGLIMTPPAVLMGVHFPLAVRAVISDENELGKPVGQVYSANTIGGVVGAFLAGFVLLPTIGLQWTIFVAAAGNFLSAALLLGWAYRHHNDQRLLGALPVLALVLAGFGLLRPPWDPMLMTAGTYHYVSHFEDHSRQGIEEYVLGEFELVFYEEGLSSVVTVAKNPNTGNVWLANNGKVDASTTTDMPTQVLCSLLPMQFRDPLDDVLVIGLASGITAGAVSQVPEVKNLEIVELEPAIEEAAAHFKDFNHDILNDPRMTLIHNDARNHILLSEPGSYDVIVSEPSNPWISGVANLFTRDFLELGKSRLKKGGMWSQWIQMYGMDDADLKSLLRTFAEVYPHIVMFATIEDADLVLVGSEEPIVPSLETAERVLSWTGAAKDLQLAGVYEPMDLLAIYAMDRDQILAMTEGSGLNTDDNMRIEYSAPMHLHSDTQQGNLRLLRKNIEIPLGGLSGHDEWLALSRKYMLRLDNPRAMAAIEQAIPTLSGEDRQLLIAALKEYREQEVIDPFTVDWLELSSEDAIPSDLEWVAVLFRAAQITDEDLDGIMVGEDWLVLGARFINRRERARASEAFDLAIEMLDSDMDEEVAEAITAYRQAPSIGNAVDAWLDDETVNPWLGVLFEAGGVEREDVQPGAPNPSADGP